MPPGQKKRDLRLGAKVRGLRRRDGLSQAVLADQLGISASYLNLIEHNKRPLTAPLLIRIAQHFSVDLDAFSEEQDAHLASELMEAFADPVFDDFALTNADVNELAGHSPEISRAVLSLYARFRQLADRSESLAEELSEGNETAGVGAGLAIPSEEVSAVIQKHLNYFPAIESAAERLRESAGIVDDDVGRTLARHLEAQHGVRIRVTTVAEAPDVVRRYDPRARELALSEVLAPRSRAFQIAHLAGLLGASDHIDEIVHDELLTSDDARRLARVALANYFAAAVMMPYGPFLAAAQATRYDVELLGHRFRCSFEQVCHRLTTLHRPGHKGVPFHLIRVDIAGNISKRFSASGIRFARFAGACARWNVHSAFMTPGRVCIQRSKMPDGTCFFCIARTVQRGAAGYHSSATFHALGLGCRIEHARDLVYADGVDLNPDTATEVGVTCRLCPRMDCEQRAMPPLHHPLAVDENVRGRSFYATPVRR